MLSTHISNWLCAKEHYFARWSVFTLALFIVSSIALAAPAGQRTFSSPEAAVAALADAVKSGNKVKLSAILGAHGSKLITSGDTVADERGRKAFATAFDEANKIVPDGDSKAALVIGKNEWPFPIPLVKSDGRWKFDTEKGEQEILSRRIGRNELAAIQVCLAIVDAERDYAATRPERTSVPEYAAKIVSSKGKHDGLYWPTKADETPSPLGPLAANAATEGYPSALAPYHGYFYRILTAQGKDAAGGAYSYIIKGKMIGGFAVVAYPARYGASGVQTFIVNHDGVVLEKDLGQNTVAIASRMSSYDPDESWKPADQASAKQGD